MMDTPSATTNKRSTRGEDAAAAPHVILAWRAHPSAHRPIQATLVLVIIFIVSGLVFTWLQSIWFSILSVLLLIGGLNRYFFPSRFTLDEQGITASYPLRQIRYEWRDLKRFVTDQYGGYLSTRTVASRLDAYRGIHLLFDEQRRDEIMACIRSQIEKHTSEGMS